MLPKQKVYCVLALVWAAFIVLGSSDHLSAQETEGKLQLVLNYLNWHWTAYDLSLAHFFMRKMGHVLAYGLEGFLWFFALGSSEIKPSFLKPFFSALGCTAVVACWDEWHQSHLLQRSGSIHDVALDLLGASVLICIFVGLRVLNNRRNFPPVVS